MVITSIPYQVNKAVLNERIAQLVREKKIEGIKDIRDESNREGIRVAIDLRNGVEPGSTPFLKSIATLIPSLLDSSLISLIPSIFFSLTNCAILSFSTALFTWYGIEVITNLSLPFFKLSTDTSPLILNEPLPLL